MFLIFLQAETAAEAAPNSSMANILFFVGIIFVFYFFMIRPQKKQQQKMAEERNQMKQGDNVVTNSGLYGKIDGVVTTTDKNGKQQVESFILKLKPDYTVRVQINKDAVYRDFSDVAATEGK